MMPDNLRLNGVYSGSQARLNPTSFPDPRFGTGLPNFRMSDESARIVLRLA
jgi:hypothetical protein